MQIEDLFTDDEYNQLLVKLAGRNLLSFDDYRQEVFSYLVEHSTVSPRKAAHRIASKMKYWDMKIKSVSLDQIGESESLADRDVILWEDRHVLA